MASCVVGVRYDGAAVGTAPGASGGVIAKVGGTSAGGVRANTGGVGVITTVGTATGAPTCGGGAAFGRGWDDGSCVGVVGGWCIWCIGVVGGGWCGQEVGDGGVGR
jgi:hypothetical protein